jgi:hypothetical protein
MVQVAAYYLYRNLQKGSYLYRLVDYYMPPVLKPVEENTADIRRDKFNPYFDPNAILISLLTFLCLLLTFGVMFPPLAVAILVTVYVFATFEKLKIGRFVSLALEKNSLKYLDIMRVESQGVGSVRKLREALWLLATFAILFYTLFLFDTLGNEVGAEAAGWVLVVVPASPLALYLIRSVYTSHLRRQARQAHILSEDREIPAPSGATAMVELRKSSITRLNRGSATSVISSDRKSSERARTDSDDRVDESPATTFNALQVLPVP